jgi:hypothetical protein
MWTEGMRATFSAAKRAFSQATLLAHPVAGATLALAIDASNTYVGGVFAAVTTSPLCMGSFGVLLHKAGEGTSRLLGV